MWENISEWNLIENWLQIASPSGINVRRTVKRIVISLWLFVRKHVECEDSTYRVNETWREKEKKKKKSRANEYTIFGEFSVGSLESTKRTQKSYTWYKFHTFKRSTIHSLFTPSLYSIWMLLVTIHFFSACTHTHTQIRPRTCQSIEKCHFRVQKKNSAVFFCIILISREHLTFLHTHRQSLFMCNEIQL